MEKKKVLTLIILTLVVMFLSAMGFLFQKAGMTGFAVFESPGSGGDFDEGTYSNTEWNGSAVVLSSGQVSGNYTSKVFDCGSSAGAVWNNFSWETFEYYQQELPDNNFVEAGKGGTDMTQNVLLLHMNNNWQDTSGKGNHGTAYNGAAFTASSKLGSHAGIFDGTNDYVSCGNGGSLNSRGTITISAWIKPDTLSVSAHSSIVSKTLSYWFFVSTAKKLTFLRFNINDPDSGYGKFSTVSTDAVIPIGTWTHVAATYDTTTGNTVNLYINGQLSKTINFTNALIDSTTNPVEIGRWQTSHYFDGAIDEVTLWNRSLSASEIMNIYKRGALRLNLTARSCDDADCSGESYIDIVDTSPQNLGLDNNRYFQYKFDFSTDNSAVSPAFYNVNIDYTLLNSAPIISLSSPQDEASYGYNESLELSFSASDTDGNIESCWYVLNSGIPVDLPGCQNTTIDVPEGLNTLAVYVNDSFGLEDSDSAGFSVAVGAPSIVLISPINSYLSDNEITFEYTPTDIDLESCELWGDFSGEFKLNQTDNSPESGIQNTFSLNMEDGTYKWNIRCNDSAGNSAWNGNKTFHVDTINPGISITEPKGTKSSRTGIPLTFSVTDNSPTFCWYNVKWVTGENVISNTTIVNCTSTSFNVAADGDYVFNFYVNDSAENINFINSSFSVSTSTTPPSNPPSGGGGSGGGGGTIKPKNGTDLSFSITNLDNVVMRAGESRTLSLEARNTGRLMQNNCKIIGSGWILSSDEKDVNANERVSFVFTLKIPKDSEVKEYQIPVILKCQDGEKGINFKVSLVGGDFDVLINEIKSISREKITFTYTLKELSDYNKNVSVDFAILDSEGDKIVEEFEIINLGAGEIKELSKELSIPLGVSGEHILFVGASSEGIFIEDQKELLIGRITGLASFFSSEENKKATSIIVIILIAGLLGFFVVKRILRTHKQFNEHKGVIKISGK